MDFKRKGINWVGNICQKFEDLCLDVDDILCQEPLKYVENHLLTVGTNVKQFCSEFVQDVFPPDLVDSMEEESPDLCLEQNKYTDLAAYKMSNIGVEELHNDSSLKQNADIGMSEKSDVGIEESNVENTKLPTQISEVVAPAEENSSMASIFCGVNQSNGEEGLEGQVNLSTPISLEFKDSDSSLNAGETSNLVYVSADIPSGVPSANIFAKSFEFISPDNEDTSSVKALTMVSYGSSWSGFELYNEFANSEDFVFLTDSGQSNVESAEEAMGDHVTESDMETTQPFNTLKLNESCILVDSNEVRFISDLEAKSWSCQENIQDALSSKMMSAEEQECDQQATSEDLGAEPTQTIGEIFKKSFLNGELELPDHDFCESEWEII